MSAKKDMDSKAATKKVAGTKKKTKKKKISMVKIFLNLIVVLLVSVVIAVSVFGIIMLNVVDDEFIKTLEGMSLKMNSIVYAKNPETGKYEPYEMIISEEDRTWVELDKIPLHMQRAMISIEDERFYEHSGVDIKRTALAVYQELMGGSDFGGSTITQQLVKNITGDDEHSRGRKVREIARAIAVEQRMTKDEILEMYMNTIYLGQNSYGVASAARTYFNKNISDLTLAESASIVGITKYPTLYDPVVNPEENQKRRNIVLNKMCDLGYITEAECESAKAEKLVFLGRNSERSYKYSTSYFTDQIYEDLIDDFMKEKGYTEAVATYMVQNGGLKIYATIDFEVQETMDKVFCDDVNFSGDLETGTQAAMVVSDPYTGEVKGIVGGRGKKTAPRVLNRASQSFRQPGSSFKPLGVYAPAIDMGVATPGSVVDDKPLKVGSWKPKNSSGNFTGSMTVRNAIARSQNMPAINVLNKVSIDESYNYVTNRFHLSTITENDKALASLALGGLTNGVSVLEMNAAYCTFPNGGIYNEPITYTKVLGPNDEIVIEKGNNESKAISADAAYIMCDMLKGVVSYGTAGGSQIPGMDTAGKTGTSDLSKDRWFAGFTPYYCATVWYGYDVPRPVYSAYSNPALNIWSRVMKVIHEDLEPRTFIQPETVQKVTMCVNSGKLAGSGCGRVYEFVTKEHGPTTYCSSHNGANIISGQFNTGEGWDDKKEDSEETPTDVPIEEDTTEPGEDPGQIPGEEQPGSSTDPGTLPDGGGEVVVPPVDPVPPPVVEPSTPAPDPVAPSVPTPDPVPVEPAA